VRVEVRNGDISKALKLLKYKLQRQGIFRDEKRCRFYLKPSEERQRRKKEAKKRWQREQRTWLIRSGELPDPKPRRKTP